MRKNNQINTKYNLELILILDTNKHANIFNNN